MMQQEVAQQVYQQRSVAAGGAGGGAGAAGDLVALMALPEASSASKSLAQLLDIQDERYQQLVKQREARYVAVRGGDRRTISAPSWLAEWSPMATPAQRQGAGAGHQRVQSSNNVHYNVNYNANVNIHNQQQQAQAPAQPRRSPLAQRGQAVMNSAKADHVNDLLRGGTPQDIWAKPAHGQPSHAGAGAGVGQRQQGYGHPGHKQRQAAANRAQEDHMGGLLMGGTVDVSDRQRHAPADHGSRPNQHSPQRQGRQDIRAKADHMGGLLMGGTVDVSDRQRHAPADHGSRPEHSPYRGGPPAQQANRAKADHMGGLLMGGTVDVGDRQRHAPADHGSRPEHSPYRAGPPAQQANRAKVDHMGGLLMGGTLPASAASPAQHKANGIRHAAPAYAGGAAALPVKHEDHVGGLLMGGTLDAGVPPRHQQVPGPFATPAAVPRLPANGARQDHMGGLLQGGTPPPMTRRDDYGSPRQPEAVNGGGAGAFPVIAKRRSVIAQDHVGGLLMGGTVGQQDRTEERQHLSPRRNEAAVLQGSPAKAIRHDELVGGLLRGGTPQPVQRRSDYGVTPGDAAAAAAAAAAYNYKQMQQNAGHEHGHKRHSSGGQDHVGGLLRGGTPQQQAQQQQRQQAQFPAAPARPMGGPGSGRASPRISAHAMMAPAAFGAAAAAVDAAAAPPAELPNDAGDDDPFADDPYADQFTKQVTLHGSALNNNNAGMAAAAAAAAAPRQANEPAALAAAAEQPYESAPVESGEERPLSPAAAAARAAMLSNNAPAAGVGSMDEDDAAEDLLVRIAGVAVAPAAINLNAHTQSEGKRKAIIRKLELLTGSASGYVNGEPPTAAVQHRLQAFAQIDARRARLSKLLMGT